MGKIRIALLYGGVSNERYLSLLSFENVKRALCEDPDLEVHGVEWASSHRWNYAGPDSGASSTYRSLEELLRDNRFDCVYDLFHGQEEGDGHIAALLDLLGITYVGNGFHASFMGMDKYLTRLVCADRGIPVLPATLLTDRVEPLPADLETIPGFPCMIKPVSSGSSIGVRFIENKECLLAELDRMEAFAYPLLLERYCKGREFCATVVPDVAQCGLPPLPIVQIVYPGLFFDAKTKEDGSYEVVAADIPPAAEAAMRDMAARLHDAIGANVHTRTDLILDDSGAIWVLEINTHPGLSRHSIFTNQLELANFSLKDYLKRLIVTAVGNHSVLSG